MLSLTRNIATACLPVSRVLARQAGVRRNLAGAVCGALASLMICSASPSAYAQPGEGSYCTIEEFDAFLQTLKPVEGRLELKVSPSRDSYRIGDPVRFEIASPVSGDLLLMSMDSNGAVFPIFPNPHQAASVGAGIEANIALTLPQPDQGFAFVTQGPEGPSRLIAIVRPTGRELPLPCARPLTKGLPVDVGPGAAPSPPAVLPKIFEGWGYATFAYSVTRPE